MFTGDRRDIVVAACDRPGLAWNLPRGDLRLGQASLRFLRQHQFSASRLLEETGVSITPGIVYGEYGEGYHTHFPRDGHFPDQRSHAAS